MLWRVWRAALKAQKGTILKCLLPALLLLLFVISRPLAASETAGYVTGDSKPQEVAFLQPDPVAAEQLYQQWLDSKKNKIPSYNICSCVSYAKWKSGINVGSIGVALNHPVNSDTPNVGAIVVQKIDSAGYRNTGHLSVVEKVNDDGTIIVIEAN